MKAIIYNIPTGSRSLFLTYHQLEGISPGRYEVANSVIYSGPGVIPRYGTEIFEGPQARKLKQLFYADLMRANIIYLYIGTPPLGPVKDLLEKFLSLGKQIFVISCDCAEDEKAQLKRFCYRWEQTINKCGGEEEMLHILEALKKEYKKGAG